MADVAPFGCEPADPRRERAQLLIVIGIVLALTLVSLALFLNSIIYVENVGARGADIGGTEAGEFAAASEAGAEGAIRAANGANRTFENQTDTFNASIEEWNAQSRLHYTSAGSYTAVSSAGEFQKGTQIVQNETREFTNANEPSDPGNWTLAKNVTVRDYMLTISEDNLTADEENPFRICVSDGNDALDVDEIIGDCSDLDPEVETLSIYNGTDGIVITNESGLHCEADPDDGSALVDFAAGTFDGDDCDVATVFDEFDSYNVAYLNASEIEGQYRLVVDDYDDIDDGPHEPRDGTYNDPDGDPPVAFVAIWSAEIEVTYENPRIAYNSPIEVVPGEIRD